MSIAWQWRSSAATAPIMDTFGLNNIAVFAVSAIPMTTGFANWIGFAASDLLS